MPAPKKPAAPKPKGRPAETTGGLGALATGIAALVGADTETVAIIGVAAGLLPGVVTFLITHGGVRGVFASLWRGRS